MRAFSLLALLGCNDSDFKLGKIDDNAGVVEVPDLVLTPDALVYDTLDLGQSQVLSFNIANQGDADLQISGLAAYGSTAFTILSDASVFSLAPGASRDVVVLYTALGADDLGQIQISSDDPGNPAPIVSLEGHGAVPELMITPNPYSFGKVLIECSRTEPLTLSNIGETDLTIDNIVQIGANWSIDVPFALPAVIPPGESTTIDISVLSVEGDLDSAIWITANDAIGTHVVTQTATGVTDPSVQEEFWQGDGPYDEGDILFYVDQSCSMRDDQAIIMANFESFASQLDDLELDWQVGVVTRDNGCFAQGILTPETDSVVEVFTDAVDGWAGEFTEAGLSLTVAALEESQGGCNNGFVREGSKVTLIEVSDEIEQSPGSWSTYVADIQAIAPTASVTAIVGDVPNGCGRADPGTGYYEASVATGGAFLSICATDWTPYFETIAQMTASGLLQSFHLNSEPVVESIVVQVEGSTVTEWTWDAESNSVVFDSTAIPESGSHIVVYFDLAGDCEG